MKAKSHLIHKRSALVKSFVFPSSICLMLSMLIINPLFNYAQTDQSLPDTIHLSAVEIRARANSQDIKRLEAIQGTFIYSGKKNELIDLQQKDISLSEKYGRQVFAKVPGIFVYDMDGTGNQMNISARGLDPHRSWEFNLRKDGVITNSDMYGYPASHYNLPLEALEKIELVRGTSSLQYGAQFGGMINYVSKKPDVHGKVSFENISTVGSYGLLSTYNRLSGKIGKVRYAVWSNKKYYGGYRDNGDSQYNAESATLYYDANDKLSFTFDYSHSNYLIHLAGPLSDSQFADNPKASTRSRNYYNPNIHVPSITVDWKPGPRTLIKYTSSAVLGSRNSVMFDRPSNVRDSIVETSLDFNNRQVDIDNFNSYTTEIRALYHYNFLRQQSTFTSGIQWMNNDLHRRQQGKGTTGDDFNLELVQAGWGRDLHYKTQNLAIFAENRWVLNPRFSVNTGIRVEIGETKMSGTTNYYDDAELPNNIRHSFPLLGLNAQYDLNPASNLYLGWSQAYRPVIFKDIVPASIYEFADKNLKDAFGYNAEAGYRGQWKMLKWDLTAFYINYKNRLGTLAETDLSGNYLVYRTNIGDSRTTGLEAFLQADLRVSSSLDFNLFTSTSWMDGRYVNAKVRNGQNNVSVDGNKLESVPEWISRNGFTLRSSLFSFSFLYSFTAESFADALNTITPNETGSVGLVPSYHLVDLNLSLKLSRQVRMMVNANNVFNQQYYTKRPQFYPGPGIWPSDGRSFSLTLALKI